jgi:hypothetical protein
MPAPQVPDIAEGNQSFSSKMRAFHAWEASDLWAALTAFFDSRLLSTSTVSTSTITIDTGTPKTFTVETGKGFSPGMFLVAANTAASGNFIAGQVESYSGSTLVMSNTSRGGSGSFSAWTITQSVTGGGALLGTNTFSGVQNFAQGADIASAATINLTTATGNTVVVSGTTPISAVTLGIGMTRLVRAAAALPLTFNATTNNISGGVDVVLDAGDHVFYHNIGGVVYGIIMKASGQPVRQNSDIQLITALANTPVNGITITRPAGARHFRNATLNDGSLTTRINGGATQLVVPALATLGAFNNVPARYAILDVDTGSGFVPAIVNQAGGLNLDEAGLISTTAISGSSNSASIIYSTSALTNRPYRVAGYLDETQSTAGTHLSALSLVQGMGGEAKTKRIFRSQGNAFAIGTPNSVTHNFGITPDIWKITLRCTTTDAGYAVGDVIEVPHHFDGGGGFGNVWANATQMGVGYITSITVKNKGSTAAVAITAANWVIDYYAEVN